MLKIRINIAKIGLVLSILGLLSLGLLSIPAIVVCLFGIFTRSRKYALAGIVLSVLVILFLNRFTSPGFMPYPLSTVKYSLNAPPFWLSYRTGNIREVCSQYWFFGGSGGAVYYETDKSQPFDVENVLLFAEKHKWFFKEEIAVSGEVISRLLNGKRGLLWREEHPYYEDAGYGEIDHELGIARLAKPMFPFWITDDCLIMSFDTGNRINASSLIVINNEKTKMAVYYDGSR